MLARIKCEFLSVFEAEVNIKKPSMPLVNHSISRDLLDKWNFKGHLKKSQIKESSRWFKIIQNIQKVFNAECFDAN